MEPDFEIASHRRTGNFVVPREWFTPGIEVVVGFSILALRLRMHPLTRRENSEPVAGLPLI